MVRVALVGDSQLTDTSGRDVTKLGPRLRRRGHEVETLAVAGMNTRDAVAIGAELGDAEWAVYCFGANDAAPWKQVPPDEFAANYEMLLRRGSGRQLVLGPAPVVESGLPGARTNAELAVYSAIAAEVARSCNAVFVSLLDALGPRDLAADGVHLNDPGYSTLERIVIETIEQPHRVVADSGLT